MITFPSKFAEELAKEKNAPALIIKLEDDSLFNDQTLQADWAANSQESQVDYASQIGSILVQSTPRPENFVADMWAPLGWSNAFNEIMGQHWQSFRQTTGAGKTFQTVKIFVRGRYGSVACELHAAGKGSVIGTPVSVNVTSTSGQLLTFDFSSQGITISDNTEYWLKFTPTFSQAFAYIDQYYSAANSYSAGQFDRYRLSGISNYVWDYNIGDIYFEVALSGGYYKVSGYIRTQTMDLGETPANDGEWVLSDIQPAGTSITYQAWASTTGAFTGEETDLGAIVDGDPITNLKRYYRVKATLTANGDLSVSPTVQGIRADFPTFLTFSNRHNLGYEPSLLSVSSLSTTIDTFKSSTIGQRSLTFDLTPTLSHWMATKHPKNKLVKILAGFVADGFTEADYIDYGHGQVDDWPISQNNQVTINVKDFSKEWDADVPTTWESTADDVTWSAQHPMDVMLDILKNQVNVRDSKIMTSFFGSVKAALPGWKVSRTVTGNPENAKDLMEELRVATSTFFIPQSDGKIKIKRWDADEAAVDSLTDDNTISLKWDPSPKNLINHAPVYFGWDGEGDEAGNFGALTIGVDTTSQADWDEDGDKTIKDKWTQITEGAQVTDFLNKVIKRYGGIPSVYTAEAGLQKMALEAGDIVTLTTKRAPSSDMQGISNVKFQVMSRDLDFVKSRVKLILLEVESSINNQVGEMVVQQTPYAVPDHVTGLSATESIYKGPDGSILSKMTVIYAPPSDIYFEKAHIYVKVNAGSYSLIGVDASKGGGFIIDAAVTGYQTGDTVYIKAVSVNSNGLSADINTTPEYSIVSLGKLAPPSDVTGFSTTIEDNGIRLRWAHIPDVDLWAYEIRQGASWDAGDVIATGISKDTLFWRPAQGTSGLVKFWIKAIDTSSIYSTNAVMASINISAPGAVTGLTAEVIDNWAVLKWTANQGTFPIQEYEVRKGDVYATAEILFKVSATGVPTMESRSGTYKYWVTAIDTAGLYGTPNSTTATVNQPPDFELKANWDDKFTGTKTNIFQDALGNTYACVDTSETCEQHFTNNSNTTIQDFIDDGFTYVTQPTLTTASYERIFDYGAQIPGTMISMSLDKTFILGTLTITPTISVSANGTDWTAYSSLWQVFANNFRYVKAHIDFLGTGENIVILNNLNLRLSVKLQSISFKGSITDATNGLVVKFSKVFIDVQAINPSAKKMGDASDPRQAIYDFVDNYATIASGSTTTSINVSTGEGSEFTIGDWIGVMLGTGAEVVEVTGKSGDNLTVSPALSVAPAAGILIYHESVRLYAYSGATKVTGDVSCSVDGF